MNWKPRASVKSIMTLYSSVVSRNAAFHKQQVGCFRFDVFPGELVPNSALIWVTFLSLVSVSGNVLSRLLVVFFSSRKKKNTKIISCNFTSTDVLIKKKLSPTVNF